MLTVTTMAHHHRSSRRQVIFTVGIRTASAPEQQTARRRRFPIGQKEDTYVSFLGHKMNRKTWKTLFESLQVKIK
jgi:hypothetical protein